MRKEVDTRIRPCVGDIVTGSIRPVWWVRAMAAIAGTLHRLHLIGASWAIADLCFWLQKTFRKRRVAPFQRTEHRSHV